MDVIITQREEFVQDGWSVASCSRCGGAQPAQVGQLILVTYAYLFPMGREALRRMVRCDFCESPVDNLLSIFELTSAEWSHSDGVARLFDKLGITEQVPADVQSERCLTELLQSASEQSAQSQIDVTSGIISGGLVGALLGGGLGYLFWPAVGPHTPLDQLGFIFAGVLSGVLLGCILGAVSMTLMMPGRIAYGRLRRAVLAYEVDPLSLQPLASRYGRHIRGAVGRLIESAQ